MRPHQPATSTPAHGFTGAKHTRAQQPASPPSRTSLNTSGSMFLMLTVLILLMMPFSDFFRASHVRRWYSGDALS